MDIDRVFVIIKCLKDNAVNAEKLLDLGCGNGDTTLAIAKELRAEEVVGIDASNEALKSASSKSVIVHMLDLNKDKIPYPTDYFDLIIATEVMEHLVNPDNLL